MTFADAVAFCGLMIAIVSLAAILLEVHNRRLRHRERTLELQLQLAEAEGGRRAGAMPDVEERLRVLERIATDRRDPLTTQIEALRHSPAPERQP